MNQYDVVRITALHRDFEDSDIWLGSKLPALGDKATIIEVYESPLAAFDLESVAPDGSTNWAATFEPGDAEFEVVQQNT